MEQSEQFMLIIRNWADFYDSAMGLGIDKTVVYDRTTQKFPSPSKINERSLSDLFDKLPPSREHHGWWIEGKVLLICGEAIPFIQIRHRDSMAKPNNFYSPEKAIDFIRANNIGTSMYWSFWRSHYVDSIKGIEHFFKDKEFSGLTKLHHIHKCPVILCYYETRDKNSITLNPNLKELGYQTQKDPYTLFQTIYMFISGVLGTPAKEPKPVSDEIIAANHGHDGEYSFKNLPGKKRGRNR